MALGDSTSGSTAPETTLGALLGALRRRWYVLLLCLVLFPAAALLFTSSQQKEYSAESRVLLSNQSLARSLTDTPDPDLRNDRDRIAQTQIELAQLPTVAVRVLRRAEAEGLTSDDFLANATVETVGKTDLLSLTVIDGDPDRAVRLANAWAIEYTAYRARLDTTYVARTLREVNDRLEKLPEDSDLRDSLEEKAQELRTLQTLQTSGSLVVRRATEATQIAPQPARAASLALILGLIVGLGLVLLLDSLDTRRRGDSAVAEDLGVPLLASSPPLAPSSSGGRLAMVSDPHGVTAESVRRVLASVEREVSERSARCVLFASENDHEDRCELVANLAVGFARSGRRVALVDLDFMSPRLSEIFGVWGRAGVTEAATGIHSLASVTVPVPLNGSSTVAANGHGPFRGTLSIVSAGGMPDDPGDLAGSQAVRGILEELSQDHDLVLIDAPPMNRSSTAARVARWCDCSFAVIASEYFSDREAARVARLFGTLGPSLAGVVRSCDASATAHMRVVMPEYAEPQAGAPA